MRRDSAAAGKSPSHYANPAKAEARRVWGTIPRIADLRSEPAYIGVGVRRPTLSRRTVEALPVHHRSIPGKTRSSGHPEVKAASLTLTSGPLLPPYVPKTFQQGSLVAEKGGIPRGSSDPGGWPV